MQEEVDELTWSGRSNFDELAETTRPAKVASVVSCGGGGGVAWQYMDAAGDAAAGAH
jgi:hypothetical protein